jgi:hypothetical protein
MKSRLVEPTSSPALEKYRSSSSLERERGLQERETRDGGRRDLEVYLRASDQLEPGKAPAEVDLVDPIDDRRGDCRGSRRLPSLDCTSASVSHRHHEEP